MNDLFRTTCYDRPVHVEAHSFYRIISAGPDMIAVCSVLSCQISPVTKPHFLVLFASPSAPFLYETHSVTSNFTYHISFIIKETGHGDRMRRDPASCFGRPLFKPRPEDRLHLVSFIVVLRSHSSNMLQ